jgi:outer membrane protein insertion porin family
MYMVMMWRKCLYGLLGLFLSHNAYAFSPFTVQHVQVEGLKRVSQGAVLKELSIEQGDVFTEAEADQALQRLYRTGLFTDVRFSVDKDKLLIQVVERPTIQKVHIKGVKQSDNVKKMLKEMRIVDGGILNPVRLKEAQHSIENMYVSQGRYGVRVDYYSNEVRPGFVDVTFDIFEGDMAKVQEVRILGATEIPERVLLKQMHHSKTNLLSWFTNDDKYSREKWNADLEILRSYYMDRGYMDMRIESAQVSVTPDKKHIYLTIKVVEGPVYRVGQLHLKGALPLSEDKFSEALAPLKTGDIFSRQTVMDVKTSVEEVLGTEGYSFAEVQVMPEVDEKQHIMSIIFEINPKKRVYVRRISIKGNISTQDEVFRRDIPQMEGAPLSTKLIKAGKENILRRSYANRVEIETAKVFGTPDLVDVEYQVEEGKVGQAGVGLEYSQAQRLGWNLNWGQENFFGTGKSINFNFDRNQAVTNYQLGYYDPFFTVDGVGMGYNIYHNKTHLSKTTSLSSFSTDTTGMDFYWIFPTGKYEYIKTSLGYDDMHLKTYSVAQEIQDFVIKNGQKFKETTVGLGWGYSNLDRRIFPRTGISHAINARASLPGSKLEYYRFTHDAHWYKPLSKNNHWIFHFMSTVGYGNGYGKTGQLPFFKHFYAGGSRWVRGYEENDLGPKDSTGRSFGGNAIAAASFNLIFPNPFKPDAEAVRTALFFDLGQVYDTKYRYALVNGVNQARNSCLRYTVGFSLSWNSPMGPVMFSLAKPLNFKQGDSRRTFAIGAATHF